MIDVELTKTMSVRLMIIEFACLYFPRNDFSYIS